MRRTHRLVPALLVVSLGLVGLAGCGDDDSSGQAAPPSQASSSAGDDAAASDAPSASDAPDAAARVRSVTTGSLKSAAAMALGRSAPRSRGAAPTRPLAAAAAADDVLGEIGKCFEIEDGDGPMWSQATDCANSHRVEIFDVLEMDDSWPGDPAEYHQGTATWDRWRPWAQTECARSMATVSKTDAIAADIGVEPGTVMPVWKGSWSTQVPGFLLEAGRKVTICTAVTRTLIAPKGEFLPDLLGPGRQVNVTLCDAETAPDTYESVTCDEPHYAEWVYVLDAAPVLGQEFVESVDPNQPTDEQWAAMDQLCVPSEQTVIGADRDDLEMLALTGPEMWNSDGTGRYFVGCTVSPVDREAQVAGTAVGLGDGTLEVTTAP